MTLMHYWNHRIQCFFFFYFQIFKSGYLSLSCLDFDYSFSKQCLKHLSTVWKHKVINHWSSSLFIDNLCQRGVNVTFWPSFICGADHSAFYMEQISRSGCQTDVLSLIRLHLTWPRLWFPSRKQLQHRRREAEQMECALWHWSLTLQAKVTPASSFFSHCKAEH